MKERRGEERRKRGRKRKAKEKRTERKRRKERKGNNKNIIPSILMINLPNRISPSSKGEPT